MITMETNNDKYNLVKKFDDKWQKMYEAVIKKTVTCENAKVECIKLRTRQKNIIKH